MSKESTFDFSVDKQNNKITVNREFAAEIQLVWDAYTKSDILDQWWAPSPWKAKTKSMDFSEGGNWHYAMVGPNGEEHWAVATYSDIREPEKFTVQDAFADAEGNINKEMPHSEWKATFVDQGKSTLVKFIITYADNDQLEATLRMGFEEGLSTAMKGLDELLPSLQETVGKK